MTAQEKAMTPEDITRLFVERSNAGDADGVADDGAGQRPALRAGGPAAHPDQQRSGADGHAAAGRRRSPGPGRAAPAGRQLAARTGPTGVHPALTRGVSENPGLGPGTRDPGRPAEGTCR